MASHSISQSSKCLAIFLICLTCYGLGNAWTFLPAISNLLLDSKEFSLSYESYGFLSSLLVICALLASNFTGEIGRFYGMKKTLIFGLIIISTAITCLAVSFFFPFKILLLVINQILLGFGIGSLITSFSAYLALLIPKKTALVLTGTFACINLGSFSSPIILRFFGQYSHWSSVAFYWAIFFMILMFFYVYALPDIRNPSLMSKQKLSYVFSFIPGSYWIFVALAFLYAICEITFSSWIPLFLHTTEATSIIQSGQSLSYFWGSLGLAQLLIFTYLLKFKPEIIYRALPIFLILSFTGLIFAHTKFMLNFFIIIGAIGCSSFFSLTMNFAEQKFYKIAELTSGCIASGYFLGSATGTFTIGYLRESLGLNFQTIFAILLGVSIILFSMVFFSTSKKWKFH